MFDVIAEQFYAGNFGRMSKADFETLMFSIYIEQILTINGDENFSKYSDYTLAKDLGITQSKISNLKIRKQLQYPYSYNWQESFARISNRARYEKGKVKIQIPDINLYYEIKNAIEENGGFIEISLTKGLLVVPLEYFLDLMDSIASGDDRETFRKYLRDEFRKCQGDQEYIITEDVSIGEKIKKLAKEQGPGLIVNLISGVLTALDGGGTSKALAAISVIMKNVLCKVNEGN